MQFLRIKIRGPRRANQIEGHNDEVVRQIPISHLIDGNREGLPPTDIEGFIAREAGNAFAAFIRERMRWERENGIRLNAVSVMINRRQEARSQQAQWPSYVRQDMQPGEIRMLEEAARALRRNRRTSDTYGSTLASPSYMSAAERARIQRELDAAIMGGLTAQNHVQPTASSETPF